MIRLLVRPLFRLRFYIKMRLFVRARRCWAGLFGAAATCAPPLSGTRGSVGAESAIPDAPTKPKKAITKIAMNFFMLEFL